MMAGILNKAKKAYLDGGLLTLTGRGLAKIARNTFQHNDALWICLEAKEFVRQRLNTPMKVEVSCEHPKETIDCMAQIGHYHPKEVEVGLENDHLFCRLTLNGHIVGYNKLALHQVYVYDFSRIVILPQGVAFTYDTTIEPASRNKGLGGFLLSRAIQEAITTRGVRDIWGHIPPWNEPSLRMHEKVGFRVVKHIRFFSFFGIRHYSFKPEKLFYHCQ